MIIVGGLDDNKNSEEPSEACHLESDNFVCTVEYAYLNYFMDYPLLFVVDNDSKKCWNKTLEFIEFWKFCKAWVE